MSCFTVIPTIRQASTIFCHNSDERRYKCFPWGKCKIHVWPAKLGLSRGGRKGIFYLSYIKTLRNASITYFCTSLGVQSSSLQSKSVKFLNPWPYSTSSVFAVIEKDFCLYWIISNCKSQEPYPFRIFFASANKTAQISQSLPIFWDKLYQVNSEHFIVKLKHLIYSTTNRKPYVERSLTYLFTRWWLKCWLKYCAISIDALGFNDHVKQERRKKTYLDIKMLILRFMSSESTERFFERVTL